MTLAMAHMEQDRTLSAAQSLQATFDSAHFQLLQNVSVFNSHRLDDDESSDEIDMEAKERARDPAIVASDVAAQISFLRKLKFQYLEQNAKDKYIKTIVSNIDDAPIVTAEDNKELLVLNEKKKEKLKVAKASLAEKQRDIRTLAPLVEQDYEKAKLLTTKATTLAQKIIDARLALTRLRQTHPHPRLTIPAADQKLADQITEMQSLSDEVESISKKVQAVKDRVKEGSLEVENLRAERTEAEKAVKMCRVEEDDGRLVPLYDWYTASLALHRSIHNLLTSHSASENELRLTYQIDPPPISSQSQPASKPREITITLIFQPNTRQLAAVHVSGLDEMGVDVGDVIDAHVQVNDVHGVVAAILARARAGV